jgi:MFS family permease
VSVASGRVAETDSIRAVLRHGPFLRLWVVQAISQTAQNMINFALLLRVRGVVDVHDLPQANTAISLVILAFSLPAVLFGPLAGVIADRSNKRTLMALLNVARAAAVLLFLVIRPDWHVETILAAYYIVTFLFGIAGQFFAPVLGATLPLVTPRTQLLPANALFNLTFTASQLIGFAAAGPILIKAIGVDWVFAMAVAVFLICAGLVLTLPPTPVMAVGSKVDGASTMSRLWSDIKEGLLYILQDPMLMRAIGYLTLASTTFLMIAALGPDFITSVIGLPKEDIGYIVAPAGAGVLLGVLIVPRVMRRIDRAWLIDVALTMAGVMLALLALSRWILDLFWLISTPVVFVATIAGIFAVLLGVCNAFILVPSQTMLQERSHESVRARVYATFFTISNTVAFIPIFFAAAFADLFGVVNVLLIVAVLVVGFGFTSLLQRRNADLARWERVRLRHRQGPESLPTARDGHS